MGKSKTPFVKYDRWCFWFRTDRCDIILNILHNLVKRDVSKFR